MADSPETRSSELQIVDPALTEIPPTDTANVLAYAEMLPAIRLARMVSAATQELAIDLGQRYGRSRF